jgi:hypothetical protein
VCVGEAPPLADETIQVRRRDFVLRVVGLDVAHAEVVGQDDNDGRSRFGGK